MFFFFFNDTATTEIYTLSLHDALPISQQRVHGGRATILRGASAPGGRGAIDRRGAGPRAARRLLPSGPAGVRPGRAARGADRKSTRLNSSHSQISYAVFCLKKKKH